MKDGLLRCEQCGEYSQVASKMVKPLDPTTYSNSPKFESAVFKQGSMPNVCASCGAPATRLDSVSTSSMNKTLAVVGAARLMTGTPGLAVFSNKKALANVLLRALEQGPMEERLAHLEAILGKSGTGSEVFEFRSNAEVASGQASAPEGS